MRVVSDHYPTGPWIVDRMLDKVREEWFDGRWIDPCAGDGLLIEAVRAYAARMGFPPMWWDAVELRPECEEKLAARADKVIISDFMKVVPARYDVVMTNPPFSLAEEYVRACTPIAQRTLLLLRLNWIERHTDIIDLKQPDIWVLPDRPSFGRNKHGKIGTDATAYAWFDFHQKSQGRVRGLSKTSPEARAKWRRFLDEYLPKSEVALAV